MGEKAQQIGKTWQYYAPSSKKVFLIIISNFYKKFKTCVFK